MAISDIPIFSMLRTRMQWAQERQRVLAENVANADTPRFRPRDLAPLEIRSDKSTRTGRCSSRRTESGHHRRFGRRADAVPHRAQGGYEVRPTGNAVNLEEEMMKVAANQMDYQAATSLYTRSLGLIKTAIGKT